MARVLVHVHVEQMFTGELIPIQGPCFETAVFTNMYPLKINDKTRTTTYIPSSNGRIERFHRVLNTNDRQASVSVSMHVRPPSAVLAEVLSKIILTSLRANFSSDGSSHFPLIWSSATAN